MLDQSLKEITMSEAATFITQEFPSAKEYEPHEVTSGLYLTIGNMKKFIEQNQDIPEDTLILIQRVQNEYFEHLGWRSVKLKDEEMQFNKADYSPEDIDNIKESYSSIPTDPTLIRATEDSTKLHVLEYVDTIPVVSLMIKTWEKNNKKMILISPFY